MEKTKNSVTNIFQSAAIIILALAVIVQGISMGRMQKDISSMSAQIADTNRLQREIESLRSYVYSMPSRYTENSNDFTDYQYSNTGYDFATNMAKLQFSVVPTNYSAATQAKIVIKGRSDSFSADAVLENGIFTADVDVYCEDNMPVYLYLTDNGQTRSFLLDYIANPADSYRLQLRESSFEGQMKVSEGAVELEGMYNVTVDYSIYEENEKSVYPVKAVLEIYADDRLIKEIPHENIMGFDFVQEGKIYLDTTGEQHAATSVGFGLWVKEDIKNDIISLGSDISFVLRVHDNKNSEYLHTTDMFTYISE